MDRNTYLENLVAGQPSDQAMAQWASDDLKSQGVLTQADKNTYLESLMRGDAPSVAETKSSLAPMETLVAQPYFGERPSTAGADPQSLPGSTQPEPEWMGQKTGILGALKHEWLSEEGLQKAAILSAPLTGIVGPIAAAGVDIQKSKNLMEAYNRLESYDYSKPDTEYFGGSSGLGAFRPIQRTREEDEMLIANYIAEEVGKAARDYTLGGQIAAGVSESIPFMFQFASMGGLSKITSNAARNVIKGAMSKAPKSLLDKIPQAGFKYGLDAAEYAGGVAGTMPGFTPNMAAEIAQSLAYQQTGMEPEKPQGETIKQGIGNQAVEVASEIVGGTAVGQLPGKILGKLPFVSKVNKVYDNLMRTKPGQFARKAGFTGLPSEYVEEPVGTGMRSVLGLREEDKDQPILERIKNGVKQDIQEFVPTVLSLGTQTLLMGGASLAYQQVQKTRMRNGIAKHAQSEMKMDEPTAQRFADAAVKVAETKGDPKAVAEMEQVVQEDVKAKYDAAVEKIKPQPKPKVQPTEAKPAEQKGMEDELARLRSEIGGQLAGKPDESQEGTGKPTMPQEQPAAQTPPAVPPKAEAAPVSEAKAKEPWEMTHDEYVQSLGMDTRFIPPQPKGARYVRLSEDNVIQTGEHGKSVWEAIQQGKPVPSEVLAEYPELAQQKRPQGGASVIGSTDKPLPSADTGTIRREQAVPPDTRQKAVPELQQKRLSEARKFQENYQGIEDDQGAARTAYKGWKTSVTEYLQGVADELGLKVDIEDAATGSRYVRFRGEFGEEEFEREFRLSNHPSKEAGWPINIEGSGKEDWETVLPKYEKYLRDDVAKLQPQPKGTEDVTVQEQGQTVQKEEEAISEGTGQVVRSEAQAQVATPEPEAGAVEPVPASKNIKAEGKGVVGKDMNQRYLFHVYNPGEEQSFFVLAMDEDDAIDVAYNQTRRLRHRKDTLANLQPKETIEDPEERQAHYEKTKAYHDHTIEVSRLNIAEGQGALEKAIERRDHLNREATNTNRKNLEFQSRYVDPVTGEILNPPDDPTTDIPSRQEGFVGFGRPPATARVSSIVQDEPQLPQAVSAWLSRTKGNPMKSGRPGVLTGAVKGLRGFTRNFRYLSHLPRTADYAEILEAMRYSQEISKGATIWAKEKMQWALDPVQGVSMEAKAYVRAVRLKLIADDLNEDLERGVELPGDLSPEDVRAMKDEADRLYETYSAVRESYDRFRQVTREITDMLVEEGWLSEEKAKEFYFPHKVIKYLRNEDAFFGMTRKPSDPRKGYLKQRKGGADYSTDVLDRLFEHWALVRRDVQITRFMDTTLKAEQEKHFRRYLRQNNLTWKDGDPIPAGFRAVDVLPGRFYYKSHGVTQEMVEAMMAQDLTAIETLLSDPERQHLRGLLAVGRRRRYIVREAVALQMQELPTMAIVDPNSAMGQIYGAIRGFNTFIKRQILFNPLYAIPYHSTNFIGDAHRVAIALPKSLASKHLAGYWKEMLKAKHGQRTAIWDEAQRYGVIGAGWIGTDIPELETLIPVIERAEVSGAGKYLIHKLENLFNLIRAKGQAREDWLRYATFAWLIEQADAGKNIERYAIKDLGVVRGLRDNHQKAAKIARDILGDYGAIGRSGEIMADLVMPFYRWTHINLPWIPRMITTYLQRGGIDRLFGALLLAAAPYVAMVLWNYSDEKKRKIEQSLPYWRRFTFHLNSDTRAYYVNLPMDDFFTWLGVPENALDFQRYQRGMIDKRELVGRILVNSYKEPGLQSINSIGGVARVGIDLTGWETFPEPKGYRVGWKRRGLNIAGDIFGAPGTLVEKAALGGIEYDKNGNIMISQGIKETLNRAWMPVRPYTVDEEMIYRQLESNTYKRSGKYGKRGEPHKGNARKVESLQIQLEGINEEQP